VRAKPAVDGGRTSRTSPVVPSKGVVPLRLSLVLVVLAAGAFLAPGTASAQTKLTATVGPAFSIQLSDESGGRVTRLDPGTYEITVTDRSVEHNFHLIGPGVDQMTEVDFEGTVTWTVTFTDGVYRFVCDPHATIMRGQFTVGTPPVTTPPPAPKRLTGTVGPAFSISMRTPAGAVARQVTAGTYRITIRDRSAAHNFHLVGPGVNRRTGVAFRGTVTWTLRLRVGTYRFVCDPHAPRMRGSFRVR
jgi:plastocyanin